MTNSEAGQGETPAPDPTIDERAIALAIEARNRHSEEGVIVPDMAATPTPREEISTGRAGFLRSGADEVARARICEDIAIHSYDDVESAREHREWAIQALASLAGATLLTLTHLLAHTCYECGCTDEAGCLEGCSWIEPGLCSSCGPAADPETDPVDDYDKMTPFQVAIAGIIPEAE